MDMEPIADHSRFSRYRPARFFLEHGPALKAQISAATFERFERMFTSINAVLG
jgi:hypothetical protein